MESKVKKLSLLSLLVLSVLWISVGNAFADNGLDTLRETSKAFSGVAKKAMPAVVSVKVEKTVSSQVNPHGNAYPFNDDMLERFFGPQFRQRAPQQMPKQVGQGSGFIISEDGYILSNNHVVGEADKITVALNDGREFKAELIGADPPSDVAVIKIDAKGLPVVKLGDSDALEVGDWAIAVGNPFGLNASLTVGVVSAKGRTNLGMAQDGILFQDFIQTDAAINPGNSGGPLLNIEGEAIGLNTAIFSLSGGYQGVGFAIPINMAKSIKNQLIETGKVVRGFVGIMGSEVDPKVAKAMELDNINAIQILQVVEDTPAAKAELKAGDIILKLDGKDIKGWDIFRNTIAMTAPGTKIELMILRDSKKKKINVTIGSLDEGMKLAEAGQGVKKLGLQVQELTPELSSKFGYEGLNGVIVSSVEPGSEAEKAGVEEGMLILRVDRRRVSSVKEFNDAYDKSIGDGDILLQVTDGEYVVWLVLSED